jgi:hypothetical protein
MAIPTPLAAKRLMMGVLADSTGEGKIWQRQAGRRRADIARVATFPAEGKGARQWI